MMFLPRALTEKVNGGVILPEDRDPRFRRKDAKALPETVPGSVLRYSLTSKGGGTYIKGKRLGVVGLALVDAQKARRARQARQIERQVAAMVPASRKAQRAVSAAEAMRRMHRGAGF